MTAHSALCNTDAMANTNERVAMSEQGYNGWTNYETWGVALIIDNDESTYNMRREAVEQFKLEELDERPETQSWGDVADEQASTRRKVADWLKDFTETLCGIGSESEDYGIPEPSMMAQQLLGAALSDVNWDEIADNYLSELE